MKTSKRVISLVLTAIMVMTSFVVAAPMLKVDTNAIVTSDGTAETVTQTQIVKDTTVYDTYAANYLNGAGYSTGIVIPGLDAAQDYVIQGMTYYPKRDWMLVTAYHNDGTASSKVFALDAATGEFVAMFSFKNPDGSVNTDHGGGIACSEYNLYYSCGDKDRKVAYAPLSALENAPRGQHTVIQLVDEIDFVEVGSVASGDKTAYTAYVCYDQGILWMGNFYDKGAKLAGMTIAAADYNAPSNDTYNSMVFGYRLAGGSSEAEWDYLRGFKARPNIITASGGKDANGDKVTWNASQNIDSVTVTGNIASTNGLDEYFTNFCSFYLNEGTNYTIEFTSTNNLSDLYMFAPNGTHCNVKQSSQTTITKLADGRYHYSMNFTAGLRPAGADSSWPTTQSTDDSYTGTYTVRFDQDSIAAGETRAFTMSDIKIKHTSSSNTEFVYDTGSKGSPSYALGLNNNLKDVQYATVDNGKLYLSRSYGSGAGNSINFGFGETSFLTVADIDLSVPGTVPVTISTKSTGSKDKTVMAYDISNYDDFPMMPMSEGLCVIDDQIFITFESASNKYLNESSGITSIGNCEKPVDVIWQLDPYDLMEIEVAEPEKSIYYEKVYSVSEIENDKEYIIVYESAERDPVTQENILYAFNAEGNFKDYNLSKSSASTVKGYNGMIGHPISDYDAVDNDNDGNVDILYLNNPEVDDVENVRWTLTRGSGDNFRITSTLSYFANVNNLYFDADQIGMAPSNANYLNELLLWQLFPGNGDFYFSNGQSYFLWCNDGTKAEYNSKINSYYANNSGATPIYAGVSEQPGTFHCDAVNKTGSNIIDTSIPLDDGHYYEGAFQIYKRVVDEVSSTYESRVYTNLGAELQEDGTYTVELETYAISPNHYQYVGQKPTDYIIVADTSSSMATKGSTGIASFNGPLSVASLTASKTDTAAENGVGVNGYAFSKPDEQIFYKHSDGKYYKVYLAVNTVELEKGLIGNIRNITQRYWAYYVADDGLYYVLQDTESGIEGTAAGAVWPGITYDEFKNNVDNDKNYSDYSTQKANDDRRKEDVFVGPHYRFDDVGAAYTDAHTRIETLKNTVSNLVGQIAAENSQNRIALVQFGGSTGYYNTSGSFSTSTGADAFWSASKASDLKSIVSNLTTSALTSNDGIEFKYVNDIMGNSDAVYTGEAKTRNVAVIFLSDGVAGADSQSDSTAAANNIISKALTAKRAGAFVYTVMIGADGTSFNRNLYMEAVSSKYAEAASMTNLGGQNVDGVNYTLNLAQTTINNFVNFGDVAIAEVSQNNAVGLENLDANSYLREQLSEAFKFPDNANHYKVKVELVPGVFDKIGRFTFDESKSVEQDNNAENNVHWDVVPGERSITVTNYNYAKEYIAKNKTTPGNKLRVTITGLIANEDAKIQNTSINNTATTGIFKDDKKLGSNDAFKYLPTEYFNIPEYTYVLDYGIDMYDADVNGTLKSVSADLSAQRDANGNISYKDKSENGLVSITNSNQDLIYNSTPTNFADSGYCLIQRDDGTYDWFEIKVVPASNVLFEEDVIEKNSGTGAAWSKVGSKNTAYQTLTNNETDIYGFDSAYADGANSYSYGSADKATVSNNTKRSVTKTFDFIGDGIDLISACGANTGIMIVKISGGDLEKPKAYIVDTYYGDSAVGGMVYQTPIVSFRGNHGTYTVEATAAYLSSAGALQKAVKGSSLANGKLSATTAVPMNDADVAELLAQVGMEDIASADLEMVWFDDNSILNGGTGAKGNVKTARDGSTVTSLDCYLDGFRTYNPLKNADDNYAESEKNAQYINVIDSLKNNHIGSGSTVLDKVAYITGSLADGGALSFANYENVGPQNELYLDKGKSDALVLQVQLPAPTSKVQLGLRAVTGKATVKIGGTEFNVNSATEMYYDVTNCVTVDGNGVATITIQNTGSNLLAVNHIKLTGDATATVVEESALEYAALSMSADPVRANVVNGVVTPVTDGDTTEPDNGNVSIPGSDVVNKAPSFVQELIAKLFEILSQIFSFLPVGEVM